MKGASSIREKLMDILFSSDWESFDTPELMEKGIELKAHISNGIKKCDKIVSIIMEDTINR